MMEASDPCLPPVVQRVGALWGYEWYELSHRKYGLHEWAQLVFLNDLNIRDFFEEVRSNWVIQLQSFQEEKDVKNPLETLLSRYQLNKDFLERLIAQYDLKNYSTENHSEYGDVWVFNPPDNLLTKREKYLNQMASSFVLLRRGMV
jgi:hypothetical protein